MATNTGEPLAVPGRLLLIERDQRSVRHLKEALSGQLQPAPQLALAACGRTGAETLRREAFDLVLVDLGSLEDPGPDEAMARLVKLADGALVIALSDGGSVSASLVAMRAGAHDCLTKPVDGATLLTRIGELAQRHGKASALLGEPALPRPSADFAGFVGGSGAMQAVYEQIMRIAPSPAPVFITGESGTGKNLCAEALHGSSPRAGRPMVVVNCAAADADSLARELFGAGSDGVGAARRADGGTLFLDEVAQLDPELQAKLLHLLQTGRITGEGEVPTNALDIRVVCATKEPLTQLIETRQLREDLFYRLHVLPIHLPPLRQRPSDVLPLARHFLERFGREQGKQFSGFSPEAVAVLGGSEWPGNVRQLENLMRRIAVLADGGEVSAAMVASSAAVGELGPGGNRAERRSPVRPMWEQEQRIIEDAIASFGGNISLAAAALEISPSTIYRKRQGWAGLEVAS
ncbi:sigma-54 dependent transcriptional regulator [Devosia sp. 919]|uniref:sigma-54-dependent transcriptional regulator n=1 Tax=Devosia sp. 919 TaxID=2726065 RepID=UPI0015520107|nr:sigma-54 dependent transcriptional regulator [Devosia sp. 919]